MSTPLFDFDIDPDFIPNETLQSVLYTRAAVDALASIVIDVLAQASGDDVEKIRAVFYAKQKAIMAKYVAEMQDNERMRQTGRPGSAG